MEPSNPAGAEGWPIGTAELFPYRACLAHGVVPADGGPAVATIRKSVDWLRSKQRPDGSWDASGEIRTDESAAVLGVECSSGLFTSCAALLALQGAGSRMGSNDEGSRALDLGHRALREHQDATGRFRVRASPHGIVDHAIATYAVMDGFMQDPSSELLESARAAVRCLVELSSPYLAWRHGALPEDFTVRATAFSMAALDMAALADSAEWGTFYVPDECWDETATWFSRSPGMTAGTVEERAWCTIVSRSRIATRDGTFATGSGRFDIELTTAPDSAMMAGLPDSGGLLRALFGSMTAHRTTTNVREAWNRECTTWLLRSRDAASGGWSMFVPECRREEPVLATALALLVLETPYRLSPAVHRWRREQ